MRFLFRCTVLGCLLMTWAANALAQCGGMSGGFGGRISPQFFQNLRRQQLMRQQQMMQFSQRRQFQLRQQQFQRLNLILRQRQQLYLTLLRRRQYENYRRNLMLTRLLQQRRQMLTFLQQRKQMYNLRTLINLQRQKRLYDLVTIRKQRDLLTGLLKQREQDNLYRQQLLTLLNKQKQQEKQTQIIVLLLKQQENPKLPILNVAFQKKDQLQQEEETPELWSQEMLRDKLLNTILLREHATHISDKLKRDAILLSLSPLQDKLVLEAKIRWGAEWRFQLVDRQEAPVPGKKGGRIPTHLVTMTRQAKKLPDQVLRQVFINNLILKDQVHQLPDDQRRTSAQKNLVSVQKVLLEEAKKRWNDDWVRNVIFVDKKEARVQVGIPDEMNPFLHKPGNRPETSPFAQPVQEGEGNRSPKSPKINPEQNPFDSSPVVTKRT